MTSQEQSMLQDLVQKINSAPVQDKDRDAERLLQDGLSRNPNAMYVLAQTVLVQNIALEQAKRQMMSLQQAPAQGKPTSFLGSLFGHNDPQPQAPPPPQYQPVQQYAPQGGSLGASQIGGQPSFLRSAATTAAGVAAGALAFQGVESMLHGGGSGFGGGGFGGGFGGGGGAFGDGAPREEVINNYYGDSGDSGNSDNGNFDTSGQDASYGNDFSDGGGDFGGDDTNFS